MSDVRRATLDDVPTLVAYGHKLHALSPFQALEAQDDSLALTMRTLIERDDAAVFIGGGMIGVMAHPCIFNHGLRLAQEAFWFAEADGMALLRAAEGWAASQGCIAFLMGALADERSPLMARLYRRAGFKPVENFYMKDAA